MDLRYSCKDIDNIFNLQNKFSSYLKVELAALEAWEKEGLFDKSTLEKLQKASFKLEDVLEEENQTHHDVVAFINVVNKSLGEESRFFHYGLTSTDIVDTAYSVMIKEASVILQNEIDSFLVLLKQKAYLYEDTLTLARTHGKNAEITSFGLKYCLWYDELRRLNKIFNSTLDNLCVSKLSGAVGNYSANNINLEKHASKILGLNEINISSQVLPRDLHAAFITSIALLGSLLASIALEFRLLAQDGINEANEFFSEKQRGSSAMPQKRNPINFEQICGLSRILNSYINPAFENIMLWHERDISHSSVERIIIPDSFHLIVYMFRKMNKLVDNVVIDKANMEQNIFLSYETTFSQRVLNYLIEVKQINRLNAYSILKDLSFEALNTKTNLSTLLYDRKILSKSVLKELFDPKYYLKYVPNIYKKIF
ncbi:MAG: adenylosuccinate lyase [Acholeplasmatales bacterium]|jgi:adenylosuccinate lyase|nr:adenylosuccinate lyase [Acholeplasmatales bacterium]